MVCTGGAGVPEPGPVSVGVGIPEALGRLGFPVRLPRRGGRVEVGPKTEEGTPVRETEAGVSLDNFYRREKDSETVHARG